MIMYYDLYLVDTDVSDFAAVAYQAEIILHLSAKLEIRCNACNMTELQPLNRTIVLMGPTKRIVTHQVAS